MFILQNPFFNLLNSRLLCSLLIIVVFSEASSQQTFHSHNGYALPAVGVVRALVVFVEVDSLYEDYSSEKHISKKWQPGALPTTAETLLDTCTTSTPKGWITKYFHDASFGKLSVIGDFYPELLTVDHSEVISSNSSKKSVLQELSRKYSAHGDIKSNSGYSLKEGHFDQIKTNKHSLGKIKPMISDESIDLLVIIYRCNPSINSGSGFASYFETNNYGFSKGLNSSVCLSTNSLSRQLIIHELSHLFLGPNSFHNGGISFGTRKVMHYHSGQGMISANGTNLFGVSAWDRYRLGWNRDSLLYHIADANNVCSDITIDTLSEFGKTFFLRDFLTHGDAVRVKIPYVGEASCTDCEKQWLWITNHQMDDEGRSGCNESGIRLNIQIGNNDFQSARSAANYFVPLNARGNYDFSKDFDTKTIESSTEYENKFTGMSISQYPLHIRKRAKRLKGDDSFMAKQAIFNGDTLFEDSCCYRRYLAFGTKYDAFKDGNISLNTNPALVNIPTCYIGNTRPHRSQSRNNEIIHLNTLSLSFKKVDSLKNVYTVKVSQNHNVSGVQRWCGHLFLQDSIVIDSKSKILLDRGTTPTRATNPEFYDGKKTFTSASVLHCKPKSFLSIKKKSTVILQSGSTMLFDSLSTLYLNQRSQLILKDSSSLVLNTGASIILKNGSKIILEGENVSFNINDEANIVGSLEKKVILKREKK